MMAGSKYGLLMELDRSATRHDVLVDGCRIRWRKWGEGPPLVLIHGGNGSWMHWVRNIQTLSTHYAVWAVDLPGFGDSADLPGDADALDRQRRLVRLTKQSLDRVVPATQEIRLAGFSFGGLVASQLAQLRGGLVRLVLLGPAGHGIWRQPAPRLLNWRACAAQDMPGVIRHNLASLMIHSPQAIDNLAVQVHTYCSERARYWSKPISLGTPLLEALAQLSVPITFIWGEHDATAVPEEVRQVLLAHRTERSFELIASAGHWVQYEAHDNVNHLLLAMA